MEEEHEGHFRRCYKIVLPANDPIPSFGQLVKKRIMNGARWFDLVEIWHRDRIVAFGTMHEVRHRKAPAETTEPVE